MHKEELDGLVADFANKQRLLADPNNRKRKLDEVFESESDGFESSEFDDLEKLVRLEKAKNRKRLKISKTEEESKGKSD